MEKIHLLPIGLERDIKSPIIWEYPNTNEYRYSLHKEMNKEVGYNMYITSDEEIKEGDWYYLPRTNSVHKCIEDPKELNLERRLGVTKIILTTDQELIVAGVQPIDDEFLEWFFKNTTCEEVGVIKEMYVPQSNGKISDGRISHEISLDPSENTLPFYKIIIPKEEPKQELLPDFKITKNIFDFVTNLSDTKKEEVKTMFQETLEEAAANLADPNLCKTDNWIAGANYQAERMYSEDEVESIIQKLMNDVHCGDLCYGDNVIDFKLSPRQWFEQFKKK